MTVFDRIKELSDRRGISIQKAAIDMGFSENLFYQWKKSQPKADRLEKVADYFNVSTDYLLGRTNDPDLTTSEDSNNKSLAKQVMMRMNTEGLSEDDILGVEKEIEKFFAWRINEIREENERKNKNS
ncbi:helix-turn-helix domain-containing protein [Enterococcus sp. SMC-9]|uniref:helix-turn-helix domain-containing protein n=1 Tax=Enterococcus sp. SMC-9 TaxID=2862343 RepID=UPI001E3563AE|nr:helix-turn-helix transcriptional regulator [Enterococcus sp. SMC-9]